MASVSPLAEVGPSTKESQPMLDDLSQTTSALGVPLARRRSRSPIPSSPDSVHHARDDHQLRQASANRNSFSAQVQASQEEPNGFTDYESHKMARKLRPAWRQAVVASWTHNKGIFLVLVAQLFGSLMHVTTRLLENPDGEDEQGMHPFQILFARMSITVVCSTLFMWWHQTPDFPFGAKEVRWLLVVRGVGGFWGVFGLYWSLQYLPLSEATVLTFLAPSIACWACSKLINETFTRIEQIGGLVSLVGVVFIAQPSSIFAISHGDSTAAVSGGDPDAAPIAGLENRSLLLTRDEGISSSIPQASPKQRLAAVGMAMVGVCGAACAYTTIRWIGRRAHPLISVNYFAVWCTIVSTVALAAVPSIPFVLPHTARQWLLLFFIGVSGFIMQYLLTAGLRYEKGSRGTHMVYSQMLFALLFDFIVWGIVPDLMSFAGSALILGSAIVVAVQKASNTTQKKTDASLELQDQQRVVPDEEVALVDEQDDDDDHETEHADWRQPVTSTGMLMQQQPDNARLN